MRDTTRDRCHGGDRLKAALTEEANQIDAGNRTVSFPRPVVRGLTCIHDSHYEPC